MSPSDHAELVALAQEDARRRMRLAAEKRASCDGKARFGSYHEAAKTLRRMALRKQDARRTHPYACKHCDGWHLGSGRAR